MMPFLEPEGRQVWKTCKLSGAEADHIGLKIYTVRPHNSENRWHDSLTHKVDTGRYT